MKTSSSRRLLILRFIDSSGHPYQTPPFPPEDLNTQIKLLRKIKVREFTLLYTTSNSNHQ